MKHTIGIHLTSEKMPEPHRLVLVSGGIATWTGSVWLSMTAQDAYRPIEWPVKWWGPVPVGLEAPNL
jgi:hypothetical protein